VPDTILNRIGRKVAELLTDAGSIKSPTTSSSPPADPAPASDAESGVPAADIERQVRSVLQQSSARTTGRQIWRPIFAPHSTGGYQCQPSTRSLVPRQT
jgi:hypothetical protein